MLLEAMSSALCLDPDFISTIANSASFRYKSFAIKKPNGKTRIIYHPTQELKSLQRWLLRRIVTKLPVHDAASAYRRGNNIAKHAKRHAGSRYTLRLDLRRFFPSLTRNDIKLHFKAFYDHLPKDWNEADTELFCNLVCMNSTLTIGAVTSPALSNTLCFGLDCALDAVAIGRGVVYTRYADDMFFSTSRRDVLDIIETMATTEITGLDYPKQLRINRDKTHFSNMKRRRVVTGVVLTPDGGISLGRPLKRKIRTFLFTYSSINAQEKRSLAGLLAHCKSIEPSFIDSLVLKYGPDLVKAAFRATAAPSAVPSVGKKTFCAIVLKDGKILSVRPNKYKAGSVWALPEVKYSSGDGDASVNIEFRAKYGIYLNLSEPLLQAESAKVGSSSVRGYYEAHLSGNSKQTVYGSRIEWRPMAGLDLSGYRRDDQVAIEKMIELDKERNAKRREALAAFLKAAKLS